MQKPLTTAKNNAKKVIAYLSRALELDVYYFLTGGFWLILAFAVNSLLALLVIVTFSHFATKEIFGQYKFVITVLSTLAIFSLPGMNLAITQAASKGKYAVLVQTTKSRFLYSLLGSLVLLISAAYLKVRNEDVWYIFVIAAFLFPFLYSFDGYVSLLLGKKQFSLAALYSSIPQIIISLAVIGAVYFLHTLVWIVLASIVVTIILHLVFYKKVAGQANSKKDPDAVHYGKHLSYMSSLQIVGSQLDKLIVPYFLGFEQLAMYAIAASLPEGMRNVAKSLSPMLIPKFVKIKGRTVYEKIRKKIWMVFSVSVAFSIAAIFISQWLIPLMFSSTYAGAVPFAQVMFLALPLEFASMIFLMMLKSYKQVRALYWYYSWLACTSLILFVILTPKFGLMGACIARVITSYISGIQLWFSAKKL